MYHIYINGVKFIDPRVRCNKCGVEAIHPRLKDVVKLPVKTRKCGSLLCHKCNIEKHGVVVKNG